MIHAPAIAESNVASTLLRPEYAHSLDPKRKSVVSTTRLYELDREEPYAFNVIQLRRRPIFLDSFTNQIFGFPLTPAPFMTSFSRGDAAKLSARFRVLKSW